MVKRKIDKINNKRSSVVGTENVKDRLLREQQSYYDRLYYQCHKDLNKQVKVAKTFEIQKLIRKIKELNENINKDNTNNEDNKNKNNINNNIEKQERKLNEIKKLDTLEPIIQECFRRLGIIQINPSYLITHQQNDVSDSAVVATSNDDTLTIDGHDTDGRRELADDNKDQLSSDNSSEIIENNNNCNETIPSQTNLSNSFNVEVTDEPSQQQQHDKSTSLCTSSPSVEASWLYERILQHKKIQLAIEKWNDQITEYRRWCLRQEERFIDGIRTTTNDKKNNKKSKKDDTNKKRNNNNNNNNKSSQSQQQDDEENDNNNISSSMFVKFGNNDNNDTVSNNMSHYGPESGEEPKKNRTGQRARRAKAIAIQAKKDGTIIDKSINWRQPKQNQQQQDQQQQNTNNHSASSNNNTKKSQETLHPSWEARKSNQQGIVEFQGKKITF